MNISINNLIIVHRELDAMFLEHQRALLRLDHVRALSALERYETVLVRHMKDEEQYLLPLYSERCDFPAVGAPKIYLDEHEKMRAHISLLKSVTAELAATDDVEADVLKLFGHEAFYLRLAGHHDKREADHLYPLLDAAMSVEEKRDLLACLWLGKGPIAGRVAAN